MKIELFNPFLSPTLQYWEHHVEYYVFWTGNLTMMHPLFPEAVMLSSKREISKDNFSLIFAD